MTKTDELFFSSLQSPCEQKPCENGAKCRPLYGTDGFLCERASGSIERGKIVFICIQNTQSVTTLTKKPYLMLSIPK